MSTNYAIDKVLLTENESGWGGEPFRDLKCPVCGQNYQHAGTPGTYLSDDNYRADWSGRGDLIVIPIHGECGHSWEMCLGFHKGNTTIFARVHDAISKA